MSDLNDDHSAAHLLPERLIQGYESFLGTRLGNEQARFRHLAEEGQSPKTMLIGCCDSRVSPEVIFDAGPGEIFVVRNVANLVPPYAPNDDLHGTSAALEFAILGLRVSHVVVMGHAQCGGVKAYADGLRNPGQPPLSPGDFISKWISLIQPASERVGLPTEPFAEYVERLAHEAIKNSLANLRTFPCVRELEARGLLNLHGAYFGVADGKLQALDEQSGVFETIHGDAHAAVVSAPRF